MKTFAALLLAIMLATMVYAGFWWASLTYTVGHVQQALGQALSASVAYGKPQWIPDLLKVKVEMPEVKFLFHEGAVSQIEGRSTVLSSSFFSSDNWCLWLPSEIKITLRDGNILLLRTSVGKLRWSGKDSDLTFSANEMTILNANNQELWRVSDIMISRKLSEQGVTLNLASRPQLGGDKALLSGRVTLPSQMFSALLSLLARSTAISGQEIATFMVHQLKANQSEISLDNVSFRHEEMSGAIYGRVRVSPEGLYNGEVVITADTVARLLGWLQRAEVVNPRNLLDQMAWRNMTDRLEPARPVMRLESLPNALLVNGYAIGTLPNLETVVERFF